MRAFLNGQQGNIAVPAGSNILGRGQDCGLRIDDPRLSRHHARLLHDGTTLIIEDLGSTNGVLVNGERIHGKKNLLSGDTVICGPCVFSVAIDPTQKATASELVPGTDRKPDPRQTESMDPLELPGSDRKPTSKPGRQINPMIAAAISGSGEFTATNSSPGDPSSEILKPSAMRSDVSSDVLKPNDQLKVPTAPLIHRSDTTPRGNPIPAPSEIAKERQRDRKEKTTGLIPNDFTPNGSVALQPDFVTPTQGGPAPAWKRCFAGIADSVTLVVLMAMVGLPLIIGGYTWALSQAGAVSENGLPQLTSNPGNAASPWDLITSVFHPGGVARGVDIALRLMRADDQQPFLTLFVASSLGVLFILVTIIIHLIGATVVRGAPFWHRRVGIEIVEYRTGYHLTWGRSVVRWIAYGLLWPLAPIALGLDKRSLHDVVSGCAVRSKRR
jgi:FHA domain